MKLKLELAKLEREQQKEALEQQKEALQLREREAAIRKEEQEREAALREREAAMRKEEQEREVILKERETAILRERERVQLEAKQRHLEIQCEHDKQQADMVIKCRQRELTLETLHYTQRQQATASLPVSFNISHATDKEETDYIKCAKSADTYSLIHRLTQDPPSTKKSWYSYDKDYNSAPLPCSNTIRASPDITKPFFLHVDASGTGIGGDLMQQRGEEIRPVSYYSYKELQHDRKGATLHRPELAVLRIVPAKQIIILVPWYFDLSSGQSTLSSAIRPKEDTEGHSSSSTDYVAELGPQQQFSSPVDTRTLTHEGKIDSETHENYSIADKHALAVMKFKLELANIEREQQKEALQIREREAALRKEEQEREVALKEREMALKKEDAALHEERERVQLEARQRHLEMQREHDKKQADMALACHQQELALETTHHTQRQQATASLPECRNNHNYVLDTPDRRRRTQLCHINLLKEYKGIPPTVLMSLSTFKDPYLHSETFPASPPESSDSESVPSNSEIHNDLPKNLQDYDSAPLLCSDPILASPDITKPFLIKVDASSTGIGGVLLLQRGEEVLPNFNLKIFYIKGSDKIIADSLSRVYEVETATPTSTPATEVLNP
ncbi:trichohyalin-like [Procambarus clarkii]|uniref:trichohyalin-like n=1 Tax=Procambarus clarkii TaxID=6728 RepID=UPI003743AB2E